MVDAQDPGFVDAYMAFIRAATDLRSEQEKTAKKKQDREAKHHKYDSRHH